MLTEKQIEYLESNGYKQIADEYVALNGNIFKIIIDNDIIVELVFTGNKI